ncbi:hypothetical protein DFP73DRAFT_620951 [Morchella snyderi]|nr:hypothetical protein DFP73DRAFT_620951 [Morchella snyderi]
MEPDHPIHSSQYNSYFREELDIHPQIVPSQAEAPYEQFLTPIIPTELCCCQTQSMYHNQWSQQLIHLSKPSAMSENSDLSPQQSFQTHNPCKNLRGHYTQPPAVDRYDFRDSNPTVPPNNANLLNRNTWDHQQASVCAPPQNLHELAPGAHGHKSVLAHSYHPQNKVDGQGPVNEATPRASGGGGCDFMMSPGYNRIKNGYNLFDCVENCSKGRYGARGFTRRGNLIVHLRNCHHQTIPKYDRGGTGKKKGLASKRGVDVEN